MVENTVKYREENNVARKDFLQMLIDIKNNKEMTDGYTGKTIECYLKSKSDWHRFLGDGTTLTMDEIAAQSFVFFLAGFETSSTTMTFALYELAIHPEIQETVREEIHTVLKKYDNKVSYDSLKELNYMGKVIDGKD